MDGSVITALASVIVAIVAAGFAYASQRAASKASTRNTDTTTEAKRLEQAYERARKFDIETIERQDKKIKDQEAEIQELQDRNEEQEAQILALRHRVAHLEQRLGIKPPEGEFDESKQ